MNKASKVGALKPAELQFLLFDRGQTQKKCGADVKKKIKRARTLEQ